MVTACWSVKGGSGVSVVAAALASTRRSGEGTALVDLGGDQPCILGCAEPDGPGVAELAGLRADAGTVRAALVPLAPGLGLLPRGRGDLPRGEHARVFAGIVAGWSGPTVVDCGVLADPDGLAATVVSSASRSLLVVRPCIVALRRAVAAPWRADGVVLVTEPGRALGPRDVEGVLGAPVIAVVPVDPTVARVVDAGLLLSRPPRLLAGLLDRVV